MAIYRYCCIRQLSPMCNTAKLPKTPIEDTTSTSEVLGSNFAADIIEREGQRILIVRESLSQYTRAVLVKDQTADTLKNAIIHLILDILPDTGTEIRVNGATAFQALERESLTNDSLLNKMGVKIVVGRLLNKNKNPRAENAVKEMQREILRLKNAPGRITPLELALVLKNMNSRVRFNGLTAKEILFRRNNLTNSPINVEDQDIMKKQLDNREKSSVYSKRFKAKSHQTTPCQSLNIGDLVILRSHEHKNKPRDTFIIEGVPNQTEKYYLIRKLSHSLRQRQYRALPDELLPLPKYQYVSNQQSAIDDDESLSILQAREDDTLGEPTDSTSENPPIPQDTQNYNFPNVTSTSRPRRKAAIKASEAIRNSVLTVTGSKPKRKHEWNQSDQQEEDTLPIWTTSPPSSDPDDISSSCGTTSDDDDLEWDLSPQQYNLVGHVVNNSSMDDSPQVSTPMHQLHSGPPPAIPFSRTRKFASSGDVLQRSHAFKSTLHNNGFLKTPTNTQSLTPDVTTTPTDPPVITRPSRIPKPSSPSAVNLTSVVDVSLVAPKVPLLPQPNSVRRSSRSTPRPGNYRDYGSRGATGWEKEQ